MWSNGINDRRGKKLKCENELKNPKLDWLKCFFATAVIALIHSLMSLFISGKYQFSLIQKDDFYAEFARVDLSSFTRQINWDCVPVLFFPSECTKEMYYLYSST